MKRTIAALVLAVLGLGTLPGHAATPKRSVSTFTDVFHWSCPGQDIRERAERTYRRLVFPRQEDGTHREKVHAEWRGWMRDRDTGELVKDYAVWNETWIFDGNEPVRVTFSGQTWKITIPGHGIIQQQMGRLVYGDGFDVIFASAKAESTHNDAICRYL